MTSHDGLTVALVAGEESGDRLGAALMRALSASGRMKFIGVGGEAMAAAGMPSLFPFDELGIIGFTAIPKRLPSILRRIRETADAVVAARPDVLVIIDSPDFTHRVAKRVRAAAPEILIVDYVSPTVWAWRPWRARSMRAYVDHVLALLPFEPEVHERLGGPPCTYVGHPLTDAIADLRPSLDEERRRDAEPPVLVVLPGSRRGEIERLLSIFGETVERVRQEVGALEVVLPTVPRLERAVRAQTATWLMPPRIVVTAEERWAAFRIARAALAKSGTVTLELALSGVPMVAAYKVPLAEEIVGHALVNVTSIILPNLIIGENIVPEFVQRACRPDILARALVPLLSDTPERRVQVAELKRLDGIMQVGSAASAQRAADAVLAMVKQKS